MPKEMTPAQHRVYSAIQYLGENANLRSVTDMLNLKSKNSAAKTIDILVRTGRVEKIEPRRQTLRINGTSETSQA